MITVMVTKYEMPRDLGCYYRAEKICRKRNEIKKSVETYLLSKEENEKISFVDMLYYFCRHFYKTNSITIENYIILEGKPEGVFFEITLKK